MTFRAFANVARVIGSILLPRACAHIGSYALSPQHTTTARMVHRFGF